jgi:hypothetical protein
MAWFEQALESDAASNSTSTSAVRQARIVFVFMGSSLSVPPKVEKTAMRGLFGIIAVSQIVCTPRKVGPKPGPDGVDPRTYSDSRSKDILPKLKKDPGYLASTRPTASRRWS